MQVKSCNADSVVYIHTVSKICLVVREAEGGGVDLQVVVVRPKPYISRDLVSSRTALDFVPSLELP